MPQATAQYPFEGKILDWAHGLAHRMTGETRGFVMVFAPDGTVLEIHFGHQQEKAPSNAEALIKDQSSFFLYDPFEGPVYTYIRWQNVAQASMERVIGRTFTAEDLQPYPQSVRKGEALDLFPATWEVMF